MLFPEIPECDHPFNVWMTVRSNRTRFIRLSPKHNVILEAVRITFDDRVGADACRHVLRERIAEFTIARPTPKAILSAAITGSIAAHAALTPADVNSIANFLAQALDLTVYVVSKGHKKKVGESQTIIAWSVDSSYLARLHGDQNIDEQLERLDRINQQ